MGQVIQFEEHAVARLRERLGAVEEANEDLIAFARGHSGAVASINAAVLAIIEASSIEAVLDVITGQWPEILGIDSVAAALLIGNDAFRADSGGIERVETLFVKRMLAGMPLVEVRAVRSGHPLFGEPVSRSIRAEALIRINCRPRYPCGLLALGQRAELAIDSAHGTELLLFLGQIVAATVRRCAASS